MINYVHIIINHGRSVHKQNRLFRAPPLLKPPLSFAKERTTWTRVYTQFPFKIPVFSDPTLGKSYAITYTKKGFWVEGRRAASGAGHLKPVLSAICVGNICRGGARSRTRPFPGSKPSSMSWRMIFAPSVGKKQYFCSDPISVDPISPQPRSRAGGRLPAECAPI